MSKSTHPATFTPPSIKSLLLATAGAVVVAAIVLVVAILPAEYGIDPTGAGKALGIKGMSVAQETPAAPETSPMVDDAVQQATDEAAAAAPWGEKEFAAPPAITEFAHLHDADAPKETVRITLQEGEEVEYKATLAKGEPMLFSWSIAEGDIYYDFHGEPTEGNFPEGYFLSYGEGEAGNEKGSFVAPFSGHHGWYWLNYNEDPVTIELTIQGYYSSHEEMYRGKNF
jgi:hypothetical protein